MSDTIRRLLRPFPHETPRRAQAALDSLAQWLCQSGELKEAYRHWPDFTQRSQAIHKLSAERLAAWFSKDGPTKTNLAIHCHETIVSLALQVHGPKDPIPAAADATIPLRLFWDRDELD